MKKCVFAFAFLFCAYQASAQRSLKVSDIPKELLGDDVSAVVRYDDLIFEIESDGKSIEKRKRAITIFNKSGNHHANVVGFYNDLRKLKEFEVSIYDANGELLGKAKSKDIEDISTVGPGTIYSDSRAKIADMRQTEFPYTVKIEMETARDGLLFYPQWTTLISYETVVQNSKFVVSLNSSKEFRYELHNIEEPKISKKGNITEYTWEVNDLTEYAPEVLAPDGVYFEPMVRTAPTKFVMGDLAGDMSTWKGLGEWQWNLNKGRESLPESRKNFFRNLVANASSKEEKIRMVYDYLQQNTRYVSVQLGIGGWQPFPASVTDNEGYGDCKALSFYTKSILDAVGINSYYTLVTAGDDPTPMSEDFARRQFNHVILAVPNEQDTTWLECTSQTNPFGYMGTFTGDRDVLMITEDGGKVVHTPVYKRDDNTQHRNITMVLNADGSAVASVETKYGGIQYENDDLNFYLSKGKRDQEEWLINNLSLPNFQIEEFEFSLDNKPIPVATVSADLQLRKYGSASGKRLFFELNPLTKYGANLVPDQDEERQTDFQINRAWVDRDTVVFNVPENYRIEYAPKDVKFETDFGSYETKVLKDQGKITYIRTMKKEKGVFPAARFEEYRQFLLKVVKADKGKVVLTKVT